MPRERNFKMEANQSGPGTRKNQTTRLAAGLSLSVFIALGILFWGNYAHPIEPLGIAGGVVVGFVYLIAVRYLKQKNDEDARRERDVERPSGSTERPTA